MRSQAISEATGLMYETLCDDHRKALALRVQGHPMSGKKGNHLRNREGG
jgi:hypothetical protein